MRSQKQRLAVCVLVCGLLLLFAVTSGELLFKHCDGPIDLGGHERVGNIQNACILNHEFRDMEHAWVLRGSHVERTNFTRCTFRDTSRVTQNFDTVNWKQVIFRDCHFLAGVEGEKSTSPNVAATSEIQFRNTTLQDVTFVNCSFGQGIDLLFRYFAFRRVSFKGCWFAGRIIAQNGDITHLSFHKCRFGDRVARYPDAIAKRQRGDMLFSKVRLNSVEVADCSGDANAIFISNAEVSDLQIRRTTLGLMRCHRDDDVQHQCSAKEDRQGRCKVERPVALTHMIIQNSTLTDGLYCPRARMRAFLAIQVRVGGAIDLGYSHMAHTMLRDVASVPGMRTNVSLEGADVVDSGELCDLNVTRVTLSRAVLADGLEMKGQPDWADTRIILNGTVFGVPRVETTCCDAFCGPRGCFCNATKDALADANCPPAGRDTALKEHGDKDNSCFPAQARLLLAGGNEARMDAVRLGDVAGARVCEGNSGATDLGAVFFFGHKAPRQTAHYLAIQVAPRNRTLRVSRGHFVYLANGTLRAASGLQPGTELLTVDGIGVVTRVRTIRDVGIFAPITTSGTVVVDGVFLSCFTNALAHSAAMALLAPPRGLFVLGGSAGRTLVARATWLHQRSAAHWGTRIESAAAFAQRTLRSFSRR